MPKLRSDRRPLDHAALEGWVRRRRNAIRLPAMSAEFVKLLKRKRRGRASRTRRFFGEVFVASLIPHREAYYNSVKWLTNPRFARTRELVDADHERLRAALHLHFGEARIAKLQREVMRLARRFSKELRQKLPTAPDLWLVDKRGKHRFIEVKLPGDSVAPHQLAGMAAIATVLGSRNRVSVELLQLDDDQRMFKAFCRAMKAG